MMTSSRGILSHQLATASRHLRSLLMDLWYFHPLNYSKKVEEIVVSRDRPSSRDELTPGSDSEQSNAGLVLIKPAPRLAAEPPGIDHLDQQRARPVLGVAQAALHHAHDVEADVESDEVR